MLPGKRIILFVTGRAVPRACVPFYSSVPAMGTENDDKRAGIIQTSALQAITAYYAADTVIRDDLGVVSAQPPRPQIIYTRQYNIVLDRLHLSLPPTSMFSAATARRLQSRI